MNTKLLLKQRLRRMVITAWIGFSLVTMSGCSNNTEETPVEAPVEKAVQTQTLGQNTFLVQENSSLLHTAPPDEQIDENDRSLLIDDSDSRQPAGLLDLM